MFTRLKIFLQQSLVFVSGIQHWISLREKVIESFKCARLHWQHFVSPDAKDKNRFGLEVAA
ncbi:MAG: hypothetical protein KJZ78_02390 [Bryobacteraceae bacterium]|nr:hypothetical protein [Bryobacteraceae bacterium]